MGIIEMFLGFYNLLLEVHSRLSWIVPTTNPEKRGADEHNGDLKSGFWLDDSVKFPGVVFPPDQAALFNPSLLLEWFKHAEPEATIWV